MIIITRIFCSVSCDVNVIAPNIPDLAGHPTKLRHAGAKENKTEQMIMSQTASLAMYIAPFLVRIIKYNDK